jgi:hypothetical protein
VLSRFIRITSALEILLLCVEGAIPGASDYLPLGHSHLAQLGFMFGLGIGGVVIWEAITSLWTRQ